MRGTSDKLQLSDFSKVLVNGFIEINALTSGHFNIKLPERTENLGANCAPFFPSYSCESEELREGFWSSKNTKLEISFFILDFMQTCSKWFQFTKQVCLYTYVNKRNFISPVRGRLLLFLSESLLLHRK